MKKEFFDAVWTFVAITVGAGIFGLPYVFYKSGFLTGLVVMAIIALVITLVTLYLGEVVLRTNGKHQLSGLAEKYLGKNGKTVMFIANLLSIYGALAAYILGGGQALAAIFGGTSTIFSILFFIVVALVIYFGINILEDFEDLFSPLKIVVALVLSFLLFNFLDFSNIDFSFSFVNIMIPYGVAIFAFTGISALPEMNMELKNKRYLLWAIITGMVITFVVYLLFVFGVVGSLGSVGEIATTSLNKFGFGVSLFANLFALLAMATAFVALGFAFKDNLTLDYKISNFPAWLSVVAIPLILSLTGFFGFVKLIELSGAIAVGIILIMILLMHSRAKKLGNRKPEYEFKDNFFIKIILFLILVIGIIYSIFGGFI